MIGIKLKDLKNILLLIICFLLYSQEVSAQLVSPPTLISPVNGSADIAQPITLVWDHPGGSYRVQVSTDASFNNIIIDESGITNEYYTLNSLSSGTTYYWRVNATSLLFTSAWSSVWNFKTAAQQTIPSVPTLASPGDGSTDQPTTIILEWNAATGAERYWLQIATEQSFSDPTIGDSLITEPSKQINNLATSTTYYWRVKGINSAGSSSWSSIWSFTTVSSQIDAPPKPTLVSPVNNAIDQSTTITFTWNPATNADHYFIQVATDQTFSNMVYTNYEIAGTSQQVTDLKNNTTYYWQVRAANAGGQSPWSSQWIFTTALQQTLAAPVLSSPVNGSTEQDTILTLTWNNVTNASNYHLQVAEDVTFNNIVYNNPDVALTSQEVGPLSQTTQYFWRVNAGNNSDTSDWSQVWNFITVSEQAIPSAPSLLTPSNGSTDESVKPILAWNKVSTADKYHLQVAKDEAFNNIIFDDSTITADSYSVGPLDYSTLYFWRVNAINNSGKSNWSPSRNFTTSSEQTVPLPPELVSPANDSKNLSLPVTLVWDHSGGTYRVQVATDGSFNNLIIDVSDYTEKSYTLNTLSENTTYYWRVNATSLLITSDWSTVWNFTTASSQQTIPSVPALVSPANNTKDESLNPILTWDSVSTADSYRLQVADDNTFNNIIFDSSNITLDYQQVGPLSEATQYFWRVNAKNSAGTSGWSTVWNFTTASEQTIPSAPVLVSPADNSSEESLNPFLSWNKVSTADYYRLQVAEDETFNNILYNNPNITSTSQQVGPLAQTTQYFWRVNAKNSSGTSSWSAVWNFITASEQTIPSTPVLVSPVNGKTNESLHPILSWDSVSTADSYRLQVAEDNAFNNIIYNDSTITLDYQQVGPLKQAFKYFWRVNAKNSAGVSSWSNAWNFTTLEDEDFVPLLISPDDGARNLALATLCVWDTIQSAQQYEIQVSTQPDFSSVFLDETTTKTYQQLENLNNNTTYFWRVRAQVDDEWHQYASSWQFTTRSSTPTYISIDTTITFPLYEDLSKYKTSDYKIIGIPGTSHIPINDFLEGTILKDWQAYWDNGKPSDYLIAYNENDFFYTSGKAFWIINKGPIKINATIENAPLNNKNNVEVPLHSGWNMISNPLTFPIPWDTIKAINNITEPIYSFNGSYNISQSLHPFEGYYFFNSKNLSILELPSEISIDKNTGLNKQVDKLTDAKGWVSNIKLTAGEYVDSTAWFGVSTLVTNDFNYFDIHKPRNWGSLATIYFARPEWDKDYPVFASDIRPLFNNSSQWTFEIISSPWQPVTLTFNLEEIPGHFNIFLYNNTSDKWVNLKENSVYQFTPVTSTSSFKIMVGKEIKDNLVDSSPLEFDLGNNYPNPFNLSTTIPITLPEKSDVEISVFNVIGNQIKTIYKGTLTAGKHWFRWDGTDNKGNVISSGVYFYRLSDYSRVSRIKKMVLVK